MDAVESPVFTESFRLKAFREVRDMVENHFPRASEEAKMKLIGDILNANSILLAADRITLEVVGPLDRIADALEDKEEK